MDYRVPELGEGVYEAELVEWLVRPGDDIHPGQNLAEVVTDKATIELPSPFAGTVECLAVQPGQTIRIGEIILAYAPQPGTHVRPNPSNPASATIPRVDSARQDSPRSPRSDTSGTGSDDGRRGKRHIQAAPAVRRMASALGINLGQVRGSGPRGRILIEDLASSSATQRRSDRNRHSKPSPILDVGKAGSRIAVQGVRRQIAQHMIHCKRTIPHYSVIDQCDVTEMMKLCQSLKKTLYERDILLTPFAFYVRAVVAALQEVPVVNASLEEETAEIVLHDHYHIGIATTTAKGLMVPVIHDADRCNLAGIAREIERLTRAARAGQLARDQLRGGTFTISSVSGIGGMITTPIINHPQVGIMGIGRLVKQPVYDDDGRIVPANLVHLSFSFDHRVIDGSVGATFASAVIRQLQNPAALLLDPDS